MEEHVLSLSYGKDSLACLGAIEQLGWPLDRIIHAEVWATDTIPADPPPMVEFKAKADAIIKERWGIEVEHLCATNKAGEKVTYEKLFYHVPKRRPQNKVREQGSVVGFPIRAGHSWCTRDLKTSIINNDLRGGDEQTPDSRTQSEHGARNSKTGLILGFPIIRGNWCTSDLKRKVFLRPPCTRGKEKYCAVSRHCSRRAGAHCPAPKTGIQTTPG